MNAGFSSLLYRVLKSPARYTLNLLRLVSFFFSGSRALKRKGLKGITPLGFFRWHNGACYFLAESKENKKFFIKSTTSYAIAQREYEALRRLSNYGAKGNYFPKIYWHLNAFIFHIVVMEYVKADSLASFMRQAKADIDQLNALGSAFLEVLDALSACGIVHRDIRPSNIFLDFSKKPIIKIFDFGLVVLDGKEVLGLDKKTLFFLGENFRASSNHWDDAASFLKIYEIISGGVVDSWSRKIRGRINRLTFSINGENP